MWALGVGFAACDGDRAGRALEPVPRCSPQSWWRRPAGLPRSARAAEEVSSAPRPVRRPRSRPPLRAEDRHRRDGLVRLARARRPRRRRPARDRRAVLLDVRLRRQRAPPGQGHGDEGAGLRARRRRRPRRRRREGDRRRRQRGNASPPTGSAAASCSSSPVGPPRPAAGASAPRRAGWRQPTSTGTAASRSS